MLGKTCLSLVIAFCFAAGVVQGQQKKPVPPPPKPADEGPSLEVTMKFIQDKLSELDKVNYIIYVHNNQTGQDWSNHDEYEVTKLKADASTCSIAFHWKASKNGEVTQDADAGFNLKDVENIVVMSGEQNAKEVDTATGHPEFSYKIDPPVFVLTALRPHGGSNTFDFFAEQAANRVAKALTHAVELCGGGNKDPF